MQGSDFHVPGQTFIAQPGGQVGGGGISIGIPGGRGPPSLTNLRPLGQAISGLSVRVPSIGVTNAAAGIKSQSIQVSLATSIPVHSTRSIEMGKQTHLQNQPPPLQQAYVPNRPVSQQNYYSTSPRPQQPRNINHRNSQPANQGQVVGVPGVGTASGQPTAIYPHPSIAMQPPMYVQSQVSSLHTSPHQQNVYSMNNQMPIQYSGPPQRHQTHQNQFAYQSYQTHALLSTSNLFGYSHGAQHPGYFYQQPPSAQINLNRSTANTPNSSSQHISGPLTAAQSAAIIPQGSLHQQSQTQQTVHSMNLPLPQAEVFTGFNSSTSNVSSRSKKPRTKAITDIVNPNTGKNISAEIYKDDIAPQTGETNAKESPESLNCTAELVVADFAARVAKLASESPLLSNEEEKSAGASPIGNKDSSRTEVIDCADIKQFEIDRILPKENLFLRESAAEKSVEVVKDIQRNQESDIIIHDDTALIDPLTSIFHQNIKDDIHFEGSYVDRFSIVDLKSSSISRKPSDVSDSGAVVNKLIETQPQDICSSGRNKLQYPNEQCTALSQNMTSLTVSRQNDDADQEFKERKGSKVIDVDPQKVNSQLGSIDGITMQKQKNKNKVKSRESNRRDTEKEEIMDVAISPILVSPINTDARKDTDMQQNLIKEESSTLTKDIKEKDNYESKKERTISDTHGQRDEKNVSTLKNIHEKVPEENEFSNKDSEDVYVEEVLMKTPIAIDVVDHVTVKKNKIDQETLSSIVAQKNEENVKVSGLFDASKDDETCNDAPNSVISLSMVKAPLSLKYTYSDEQWSPINLGGKKVYGRDFLMKLQNDPNSKIKPSNLPDLEVVLKDSTKARNPVDFRFKDPNLGRHDSLLPGFVKSSMSSKVLPPNKKSHSGKPKSSKPNVIHVSLSLREDVKLRETENAWKPTRLVQGSVSEEDTKTQILYKKVRSVLNKLTPQKFSTLVNQVRDLQIDTQERLQGVIDLVFEKAVDEPNFSVAYALMCKELSNMEVTGTDSEDSCSANFRKLILTRCQTEFEKNTVDENLRCEKLREIDKCTDPEKKKELQVNFDEEERRIRVKSVGNIRFIGELFKQNMLTTKIMHTCIKHLLKQTDEENLECLCKLLETIGKVLESKNIDLSDYFKQMQQIANRKGKISSRIRFMLQDVIDLKGNKWIPRRDDSNPKTMDQIQKEAESERLDIQFNNPSLNTSRKDERNNERKRNRGVGSTDDGGWSQPVGRTRQVYSVETAKLKNKPPSMDDMQLGSRSTYQWPKPNPKMTTPNKFSYLENIAPEPDKRVPSIHLSGSRSTGPRDYGRLDYKSHYDGRSPRNSSYQMSNNPYPRNNPAIESSRSQSMSLITSSKSTLPAIPALSTGTSMTEDEFQKLFKIFFEEYIAGEEDVEEAVKAFKFPTSSHVSFMRECINGVLEKSDHYRNKTSQLFAQLLSHNSISLAHFKDGLEEIFRAAGDLIIDIPKLWKYFAKLLVYPVINNTLPLRELLTSMQSLPSFLRDDGQGLILVAEVLSELKELKGIDWTNTNWRQSGLSWHDFTKNDAKIDQISSEYALDFFVAEKHSISEKLTSAFNVEEIHLELLTLFRNSHFDDICNWIQENVGEKVKEPLFIRILMTAILETSIEQPNDKSVFKVENFDKLQKLIQRYVDADDDLELQCLFAVQAYINKLSHPAGLIVKIMTYLCENNVLSNEAFLAWEKNEDPAERSGKSVALLSLKSFFTPLKEVEDISSSEEA